MHIVLEAFKLTFFRMFPCLFSSEDVSSTDGKTSQVAKKTIKAPSSLAFSKDKKIKQGRPDEPLPERREIVIDWEYVLGAGFQRDPKPIENTGSDCFFSSFFQIMLNSQHVLEAIRGLPDAIEVNADLGQVVIEENKVEPMNRFIYELKKFTHDYFHPENSANICKLRSSFSAALLGRIRNGQQDVNECWYPFSEIFDSIQNREHRFKVTRSPEENEVQESPQRIEHLGETNNPNCFMFSLLKENREPIEEEFRTIPLILGQQRLIISNPENENVTFMDKFGTIPPFLMLIANRSRSELLPENDPPPKENEAQSYLTYLLDRLWSIFYTLIVNPPAAETFKVETPIKGELFDLNLAKEHVVAGETDVAYKLTGFTVHQGRNLSGGHYISYIKKQNQWHCCNDSNISPVGTEEVRREAEKASSLFYSRN